MSIMRQEGTLEYIFPYVQHLNQTDGSLMVPVSHGLYIIAEGNLSLYTNHPGQLEPITHDT